MVVQGIGSEFWLLSARNDGENSSVNALAKRTGDLGLVREFNIPNFKVGTLDTLIGLSDDLARHDLFIENLLKKICHVVFEMMEQRYDKIVETLVIEPTQNIRMDDYIEGFHWDMARYQMKQSLRTLVDIIVKQVVQIEKDQKSKTSAYFNVRNMLGLEERKISGPLVTRALYDLVKKDDFVLGSEFMVTVLVVVNKNLLNTWWSSYMTLCNMVVPNSSKVLHEDNEYVLVNCTVFRKELATFKTNAKENKFLVRDFEYDEAVLSEKRKTFAKLLAEKDKYHSILIKWLKVNFSETFVAWIHLKAIRVFVESVLRYGLPVDFKCVAIHTTKKNNKRLEEILEEFYRRSGSNAELEKNSKRNQFLNELKERANNHDIEKIIGLQNDLRPYVYLKVNTAFLD